MQMRFLGGLAAAACLVCSAVSAAEMVDNPGYKNWAKYKPGTSVTYKQEVDAGGMKMVMESTQKLVEITPEQAVIEMSMKNEMMPQQMPPQRMNIPAKIEQEKISTTDLPPGVKGEAKPLGNETIEVGGKKYDCKVVQFSGEAHGQKMEGKSWTNAEVPGELVKTESKGSGEQTMNMTMTLVKAEIKQ